MLIIVFFSEKLHHLVVCAMIRANAQTFKIRFSVFYMYKGVKFVYLTNISEYSYIRLYLAIWSLY